MVLATLNQNFIDVRSSRGIVRNFTVNNPTFTVNNAPIIQPPADYNLLDSMVRNDEVISTAFDTTVDMVSRNGWDFVPKDDTGTAKKEAERATEKFKQLKFSEVLDNWVYSSLYYGDVFVELRKKHGKGINELHILETTEMRIVHDEHGEIMAFVQRPFRTGGFSQKDLVTKEIDSGVWFKPEEVLHYAIKTVGSQVYSQTPLEPVARLWSAKLYAHNYLLAAYRDITPEVFIHLKAANKDQKEDFMSSLQRKKQFPAIPIVTWGTADSGVDISEIKFDPGQETKWVLEYLREAVLMITRVPPVWIGLVNREGSNRGNSEAQVFSFETRIRKIQQKIQDKINMELMPKLGFRRVEFNFNPITGKNEKEVLQNAAILHGMSVKPEAIFKYLKRNGITDIQPDDFIDPMEANGANQEGTNQTAPSRQGEDKAVDNMKSNLNSSGVSDAGAAKTAEKDAKVR